jgi:UDP-glucose 4-epimerase
VRELNKQKERYEVVILDNFSKGSFPLPLDMFVGIELTISGRLLGAVCWCGSGHATSVPEGVSIVEGDIRDRVFLDKVMSEQKPDAVMVGI